VRLKLDVPDGLAKGELCVKAGGKAVPFQIEQIGGRKWVWVATTVEPGAKIAYEIAKGAPPERDPPLPSLDEPLKISDLDEAWRTGVTSEWSAMRIAVCVLDAHGHPMLPEEVLGFVRARSEWSMLSGESTRRWRRGSAIRVRDDGRWELDGAHEAVRSARLAVRRRVEAVRRSASSRPDPAVMKAIRKRIEQERRAHAEALTRMRRVLIHAFPATKPERGLALGVGKRELATFLGEEIAAARKMLAEYDIIAGLDVRTLLLALDFEPGDRRLADLGPPRKTKKLNKQGRTLKITTQLLVQGSCGISRPLGDEKSLRRYLDEQQHGKLRRRLEADAKSLFALYEYGRLHGAVRLRWGFLDEMLPAPWVHRDEPRLHDLLRRACARQIPLEVVVGSAPGWADPWSRARRVAVRREAPGWWLLVDEDGNYIYEENVQLARLAGTSREAT
jgi:hypothetical protein